VRLIVCDGEPSDINSALGHLDAPGASVLMNPQWLSPDPTERLWIACGAPAVKMVQAAGWISKKGGVEANRGKLFEGIQPDGWTKAINVGVSYAPQIMHLEYEKFVMFQADIAQYRRYEKTGTMQPTLGHYTYAKDLSGVIRYLKALHANTGAPVDLSLDLETEGLDPFALDKEIVTIQASAKEGLSDVVYTLGADLTLMKTLITQLEWIAEQPWIKIIGANLKYDLLWLRVKWGVNLVERFAFDTCNGGSLCQENRPNTLNLHTKIYSPDLGGYDDDFARKFDKGKMGSVPKADLLPYAGGDTDACLRNYRKIRQVILSDNLTHSGKPSRNSLASVYLNIVHPTLKALHKMEYTGVYLDIDRFHAFGSDLEARMKESQVHAAAVLPNHLLQKYGGVNETGGAPLSKANMIAEFLFSPQGLNLKPTMTTEKTGKPSTAEQHLVQFKDHPDAAAVIERYIDYKSVSKMHGTYYEGFLKHVRSDGRWHPSYIIHKQGDGKNNEQAAAGTVTGRGSAVAPAFQCVTGDAEIVTRAGVFRADEIIDPLISDNARNPFAAFVVDVLGSKGFQPTGNVFKSWRADTLRVHIENGNDLRCTPEHPFMTGQGWVKAKDLTTAHYLIKPDATERAEGPKWATPNVAELIGLIAACGSIEGQEDSIVVTLPARHVEWASIVLETITGAKVSHEDGGEATAISFNLGDVTSTAGMAFVLALPGAEPYPARFKGTLAFYDYLRGFFKGGVRFPRKDEDKVGYPRYTMYFTNRPNALAVLREIALEGMVPPRLRRVKNAYQMQLRGVTAAHIADKAGFTQEGWSLAHKNHFPAKTYETLRIKHVEEAGPAWVYDFTVPSTHDFYANGMLVHNTVPKHSYWGKRIRECIIAPEGHVIVARDYSQGELKVAACWAGEQKMISAYKAGVDLHALTAATVNGMSYEEAMHMKKIDPEAYAMLRQNGKAGNFGLLYGMSAYGFMMYAAAVYGVHLTIEEAEHMRDAYFELYPGLLAWHDKQIMEAQQTGQVRSPLGRIRHLPNINSAIKSVRKNTQNQAINSPIQATLVDMMWMSMGIIERERPQLLTPFAQVHDQGLWYTPEDDIDEALKYSGEVMGNLPFEEKFGWTPELEFTSDAEVGLNLAELEKV